MHRVRARDCWINEACLHPETHARCGAISASGSRFCPEQNVRQRASLCAPAREICSPVRGPRAHDVRRASALWRAEGSGQA